MSDELTLSRSTFLKTMVLGVVATGSGSILASQAQTAGQASAITLDDLRSFAKIAGITLTDAELEQVLRDIASDRAGFTALREVANDYGLVPPNVYRIPGEVDALD